MVVNFTLPSPSARHPVRTSQRRDNFHSFYSVDSKRHVEKQLIHHFLKIFPLAVQSAELWWILTLI